MARWKLSQKHYLYTDPPTMWEQVETDLATGEQTRVQYVVPRHLNPEDPKQKNKDGEVVVCLKGKGERGDITIKEQPPTADMLPLDEEAQLISDSVPSGDNPIEALSISGDGQMDGIRLMQAQINALMIANEELQRRLSASAGDVKADLAAFNAQQPKVLDPKPGRRV